MFPKTSVLEAYAFYRSASPALRASIEDAARPVRLEHGVCAAGPDTRLDGVLLVGSGCLRVFMDSETGREVTLYRIGRGQLCPLSLAGLHSAHRTLTKSVAEGEVLGAAVPVRQFRAWIDTEPAVRACTFDAMADHLIQVTDQLQQITFGRLDRRLADYLLERCRDPGSEVRVTHEQIAADLSTAREVISRLLRDFERRGAVTLGRGKVVLRSAERLGAARTCTAVPPRHGHT